MRPSRPSLCECEHLWSPAGAKGSAKDRTGSFQGWNPPGVPAGWNWKRQGTCRSWWDSKGDTQPTITTLQTFPLAACLCSLG